MFKRKPNTKVETPPRSARVLLNALEKIEFGQLQLTTPAGKLLVYTGNQAGPSADIAISSWEALTMTLDQSDVGLGEAYMRGLWTSSSLPDFLIFVCQNEASLRSAFNFSPFFNFIFKLQNKLRVNSKQGSRRNIMAHYDLGNEFYELWLDPSMTYSSGLYKNETCLATSQKNKMGQALSLLSPHTEANILEIGCGWGSFLEYASKQGLSIEGITISPRQRDYCQTRLKGSKANVSLLDYRDLRHSFDHIVSIEMFEAVGQEYWGTFLNKLNNCLKPNGSAVIQTITIRDDLFETYRKSSDFIRSHIFPGGFLPSSEQFKSLAKRMKFRIDNEVSFGDSYEKTLRTWLVNFNNVVDKVKGMGFDERFVRMWQYYLSTCIAGFATGRTNVHQFKLVHQ